MENPMREIRLEKVVLNIGCGGNLEKIERAKKLLEYLTGKKPVVTKSKRRSTFGIAKGKPVGVMVTLRKKFAEEFLKRALGAIGKKLSKKQFDAEGNFSFGIKEYFHIPGVKYVHEIGTLGLDVCVSLERPGFRVKRRRVKKRKIPKKHRITREEAVEWVKKKFGVEVE
jgi:large subunit ribosomal protein L5